MNLTENGKRIGFPRKPARKCTHPSYNNMPVCQTHSDRRQASSIYFLFIYGRRLRDWDTRCLAPLYLAFPPPPALLSLLWARVQAPQSPCAAWLVTWKSFNRHEATNKHVCRRGSWILHWNVAFPVCCLGNSACFPVTLPPQPEAWNLFHLRHLPWLQALLPPCTKPCKYPLRLSRNIYSYHIQRVWRGGGVIPLFMILGKKWEVRHIHQPPRATSAECLCRPSGMGSPS